MNPQTLNRVIVDLGTQLAQAKIDLATAKAELELLKEAQDGDGDTGLA